jgi:hypothetical protein
VVVALAVHHKVALVVAAGHQCKVAHVDGRAENGVAVPKSNIKGSLL